MQVQVIEVIDVAGAGRDGRLAGAGGIEGGFAFGGDTGDAL